jgi:hypothetical protein
MSDSPIIAVSATTYGSSVAWASWTRRHRVMVKGCPSAQVARETAHALARELGWTPSAWWKIWRWNEDARCASLGQEQDRLLAQGAGPQGRCAYAISWDDRTGSLSYSQKGCDSQDEAIIAAKDANRRMRGLPFVGAHEAMPTAA